MESLQNILSKHTPAAVQQPSSTKPQRPINVTYERAKLFCEYIDVPVPVVLKLFKKYGQNKVLSLRSWLADYPFDPNKGKIGILIWKLNQK